MTLQKIALFLLLSSLIHELVPPSLAVVEGYKPPDGGQQQRNESAGSRGCPTLLPKFRVLAPTQHIALTISEHPTFFLESLALSESPASIKLTLIALDAEESLWKTEVIVRKTGLISVPLPEDIAGLETGKIYALTVLSPCPGHRPSQGAYVRLLLKRIAPSLELTQNLKQLPPDQHSSVLARNGIWYDALKSAFESNPGYFQKLLAFLKSDTKLNE